MKTQSYSYSSGDGFRHRFSFVMLVLGLLIALSMPSGLAAQDSEDSEEESEQLANDFSGQTYYVIKAEGMVDNGMFRYIERGISLAEDEEGAGLILHMDTFGGLVDAADKIRKALLDTNVPTMTFIDKNAASAGALISFSTDKIMMAGGSSIGAATVVDGGGTQASEKMQSYMRGLMRSTAEDTGRDPRIAEAMVDERIEIEGITEEGNLVTLSTSEAIELGMADGSAESVADAIEQAGWPEREIVNIQETFNESVLRFLASPVLSSILMLMMLGGLYFELQSPGVGFPGAMSAIGAMLFFAPMYIMGFAEPWEIILFFTGIVFIIVEIFILPGFGIPGIIGITLLVFSLGASLVGNVGLDFPALEYMNRAIWTMAITLILGILMIFSLSKYLPQNRMFSKLILVDSTSKDEGYTSARSQDSLTGKEGVTLTPLRPSGIALIDENRVDVVSQGDFVENGARIKVVNTSSSRVMVRRIPS
jgi:membrane-bound serine protease (ClpP class)